MPENKIYDADLRDVEENSAETIGEKAARVLREAGLISSIKFPNAEKLSDENLFLDAQNLALFGKRKTN